jgi:hypothetical protein
MSYTNILETECTFYFESQVIILHLLKNSTTILTNGTLIVDNKLFALFYLKISPETFTIIRTIFEIDL